MPLHSSVAVGPHESRTPRLARRAAEAPLCVLVRACTALFMVAICACSGGHRSGTGGDGRRGNALTITGSDTMVILAQRFAESYMQSHDGAVVQVSGGGSGTGIAALVNGTTSIATASRAMSDEERARLRSGRHVDAYETRVALDALAIYVHPSNHLPQLTLAQLSDIYRGRVDNWRELGGPDRPIVLYSRENNSGTYVFFKEHVLHDSDFAVTTQTLPGTAAVINAVSHDRAGIGYGGIAFGTSARPVPLVGSAGTPVTPTLETATNGTYPLARFLMMYTAGPPSGTAKEFLDWVLSAEGQALVEPVGYYPLPHAGARAER